MVRRQPCLRRDVGKQPTLVRKYPPHASPRRFVIETKLAVPRYGESFFSKLLVPANTPGVTIHRDWDTIGQRATNSGTITFAKVRTKPDWKCSINGQAPLPHASLRYQAGICGDAGRIGHRRDTRCDSLCHDQKPAVAVGAWKLPPMILRSPTCRRADGGACRRLCIDLDDRRLAGRARARRHRPDRARRARLCGEGRRLTRRRTRDLRNIRIDGHSIGGPRSWLRSVLAQCAHRVAARPGRLEAFRAWPACPHWVGSAAGHLSIAFVANALAFPPPTT